MLKRLIEVALPLKEVSEQSAREKSIRHGHISTLHIWWARRPLAACRAVVFASLIPDPDAPECPDGFRKLVMEILGKNQFRPTHDDGSFVKDTPRNRCLEFIKYLVRWENSNNPEYIEPAQKLIAAAHKFLHPDAEGDTPKVLDPFAGGGAIPLEALRLGCESHAIDLNPVAHLIELCTLVYPQKYGQPDSRPVPDYLKRLITHNQAKRRAKGETDLFENEEILTATDDEIIPDVEITEAEYRKNPLAADLKYWGHWVLGQVRERIRGYYPSLSNSTNTIGYIWARTVHSPDPTLNVRIPLISQLWLSKKSSNRVALRMTASHEAGKCIFEVVRGDDIDFDPSIGTVKNGQAACPFTNAVLNGADLRRESNAGRMGHQLIAVIETRAGEKGKHYRTVSPADEVAFQSANIALEEAISEEGASLVPTEPITSDRPSPNSRGLSAVVRYGIDRFGLLFNARQSLALLIFAENIREAYLKIQSVHDEDYAAAVGCSLSCAMSRLVDQSSTLVRWLPQLQAVASTFGRQALAMTWDYVEAVPIHSGGGGFTSALEWVQTAIIEQSNIREAAYCVRGTATSIPMLDSTVEAALTDPPYYDAVPYSDLSDFFYVWLKRTAVEIHPDLFLTPLTPKGQELIAYYGSGKRKINKTPEWYETQIALAFKEMYRVLNPKGIAAVMFAHKTTQAWETIISALNQTGLLVTSSWPIHTERSGRLLALASASLASSVTMICRKRHENAGDGLWDDVRQELKQVANERLDFFWDQGIRGADFFISAIGPALSVFGKYERVTKLSGEEVTVGQFLDEVRSFVTNYALAKILKTTHTAAIDPESRFYVVWKWSYGDAKVPADESFKLSQALGMHTEAMWDRTGVLEKSGENVQAVPISKRTRMKNLGEPIADGSPASLIDVLHRLCDFREKSDMQGMAQFLSQSGQANNPTLWLVAQAISEILPDGDKEKQLMQGLLNQREGLAAEATQQRELF
jgi:putative DNA methylase